MNSEKYDLNNLSYSGMKKIFDTSVLGTNNVYVDGNLIFLPIYNSRLSINAHKFITFLWYVQTTNAEGVVLQWFKANTTFHRRSSKSLLRNPVQLMHLPSQCETISVCFDTFAKRGPQK